MAFKKNCEKVWSCQLDNFILDNHALTPRNSKQASKIDKEDRNNPEARSRILLYNGNLPNRLLTKSIFFKNTTPPLIKQRKNTLFNIDTPSFIFSSPFSHEFSCGFLDWTPPVSHTEKQLSFHIQNTSSCMSLPYGYGDMVVNKPFGLGVPQ